MILLEGKNKIDSVKESPTKLTQGQKRGLANKAKGEVIKCVYHGKDLSVKNDNFYKTNKGSIFKSVGYIPVCKDCVKKIYSNYYHENGKDPVQAMYLTCRKLDVKFDLTACEGALTRANGDGANIVGHYFSQINGLSQHTEAFSFDNSDPVQLKENFADIVGKIQGETKLDAQDKKNLKDIMKILKYDPFKESGFNTNQLSRCYNELVSWLSADEDLAEDAFKLNIIIQIINTNAQIKQMDLFISLLTNNISNFEENIALLSSMNTTKSKLVDSNIKIYKENKWLTEDGGTTKNKLTVMMKRYREMGFEQAEADFIDMKKSIAYKKIQDISFNSILDQLNWDSEDTKEMFRIQRNLIAEKDEEIGSLFNKNKRLARDIAKYIEKYGELDDSE